MAIVTKPNDYNVKLVLTKDGKQATELYRKTTQAEIELVTYGYPIYTPHFLMIINNYLDGADKIQLSVYGDTPSQVRSNFNREVLTYIRLSNGAGGAIKWELYNGLNLTTGETTFDVSGTFDKLLFTVISCAVPDPTNDHVRAKFSILNKSSLPIVYQLINEDGTNPRFLLHHFGEVGVKC